MASVPNAYSVVPVSVPTWLALDLEPLGFEHVGNLSEATALDPPAGAAAALITVSDAAVRYRDDGVSPTPTVGQPIGAGVSLFYTGSVGAIEFIEQTEGAVLDVLYYGQEVVP